MGLFGGDSSSSLTKHEFLSNPIFGGSGGHTINVSPINYGGEVGGSPGSGVGGGYFDRQAERLWNFNMGGQDGNPTPPSFWRPAAAPAPVAPGGLQISGGNNSDVGGNIVGGRDVTNIEITDGGAIESIANVSNNAMLGMRDLASSAIGSNTIIASQGLDLAGFTVDKAFDFAGNMGALSIGGMRDIARDTLQGSFGLSDTVVRGQARTAERAMASSDANLQAMLAMALGMQQQGDRMHTASLQFADAATRSDEAMNSETLIKWGAGAVVGVAVLVWLGKGKK